MENVSGLLFAAILADVIACIATASIASKKGLDFVQVLFLSIVCSPVIGLLYTIVSLLPGIADASAEIPSTEEN